MGSGSSSKSSKCELKFFNSEYKHSNKKGINVLIYVLTLLPLLKKEVYESSFSIFYMCLTFPISTILDIYNTRNKYNKTFSFWMLLYMWTIEIFGILGCLGILNINELNVIFDSTTIFANKTLFSKRIVIGVILISIIPFLVDYFVSSNGNKGKNIVEEKSAYEGA